ncbi:MAG: radical SAM protein, partial [Endomicrobiaceae bacterium]|nr:radical SAM protein [Endomicrobiaceae bacterium]
ASFLEQKYPDTHKYIFLNLGYDYINDEKILEIIINNNIDIVHFSTNVWETAILHRFTKLVKNINKNITVIVSGQLASIVKDKLLQDENIDITIYGESYVTFKELVYAINKNTGLQNIEGICYRKENIPVINSERQLYENVDEFVIVDKIWDLIDIKKYSKYLGWNGINQKNYYIPVLASFGCPFDCTYCTNRLYLGNKFRKRSINSVVDEIQYLIHKFNIYEIHFFDAVFNCDITWSKKILQEIIDRKLPVAIAFPHGLRVDCIDEELINLFKKAGVYKVTYAIETASPSLQKQINKNLDLNLANKIIELTAKKNIIVCGYFMLGFENESENEMLQTISYACNSKFDIASFFKYSHLYDSVNKQYNNDGMKNNDSFMEFSYFSNDLKNIESMKINYFILLAQRKFYLNIKRLLILFIKSKKKIKFIVQTMKAICIITQGYLISKIYYNLKKDKI